MDNILFSQRAQLSKEYEKWIINNNIADTPFNVISFLESYTLLDRKKVQEFLKKRIIKMDIEEAKKVCERIIQTNNKVIKETRKNGDINTMKLTASLDNESIAIETVLKKLKETKDNEYSANCIVSDLLDEIKKLEKKDKIIDMMAEEIFISRNWALTGNKKAEDEIEDIKYIIIKEFEGRVANE